jgi:hypothetical protein
MRLFNNIFREYSLETQFKMLGLVSTSLRQLDWVQLPKTLEGSSKKLLSCYLRKNMQSFWLKLKHLLHQKSQIAAVAVLLHPLQTRVKEEEREERTSSDYLIINCLNLFSFIYTF